jgi:hypothetical protein
MLARRPGSGLRVRAAIALTTACLFVACGLLAMHHASDVAHVHDESTGVTSHAVETECADGAPTTHLHSLPDHEHQIESCTLTDVLHQVVQVADPIFISVTPQLGQPVELRSRDLVVVEQLLLSAPKTSPPVRA